MSDEIRIGIVGCGAMGQKRMRAIHETGLGRIARVFDIDAAAAESLAQSCDAHVVNSPSQVLSGADVNAVVIGTPHAFLAGYTIDALRAGKHVLVEKPAAISIAEVQSMMAAHREANQGGRRQLCCKVGYNHRFHVAAQRIDQLLRSGQCGPIVWIRGAYGHGGRPGYETEWRFRNDMSGGGALIDQGVHLVDLAQWWCGGRLQVCGAQQINGFYHGDVEDNAFLLLRSPSGVAVQLHASITQWKNLFRMEICTTLALMMWEGIGTRNYGDERLTVYRRSSSGPPTAEVLLVEASDESWAREWAHFYECIKDASLPMSPLDESLHILRLIEEAYAADQLNLDRKVGPGGRGGGDTH